MFHRHYFLESGAKVQNIFDICKKNVKKRGFFYGIPEIIVVERDKNMSVRRGRTQDAKPPMRQARKKGKNKRKMHFEFTLCIFFLHMSKKSSNFAAQNV